MQTDSSSSTACSFSRKELSVTALGGAALGGGGGPMDPALKCLDRLRDI